MNSDTQALPFSRRVALLILLALALGIYVGNAAQPSLLDDADAGHAEAAREMLATGDWTILHINGVRWMEKPPLHYWLVATSYALFGESAFTTRLPLALCVAGLVWMVCVFGRRYFGERAGFYAGLILCTGIGTYMFTRIMIPEAIYALQFTATFYLFLLAWQGKINPRLGYWGCAVLIGLAVITRGLVGLVFPPAIIVLFLLATGGWRRWRELPLISSTLIFLVVAVPWHVIAALRAPGVRPFAPSFLWYYFVNEQMLRAIGARYPDDYTVVPLGLWWTAHLIWLFPWSLFAGYGLRHLPRYSTWQHLDEAESAKLFVVIWAAFVMLFFSVTSSRMEYYSFCAWPALALLAGIGLNRAERENSRWLPRLQGGVALVGALAAAVLCALLWVSRNISVKGDISSLLEIKDIDFYRVSMGTFFDLTPKAFAALRVPSALAAVCFLVGFPLAWIFRRRGRHLGANLTLAVTMACFFFIANIAFKIFEPHMSSRPLADVLLKSLRPEDQVVVYGEYYGACALGFYTKRQFLLFNGRYQGLEAGSYYPDVPKVFIDDQQFPKIWSGSQRVFLFAPQHQRQEVLLRLPPDSTYLLAEIGGKAIYINQPIAPGQPTLADLRLREARILPPADR